MSSRPESSVAEGVELTDEKGDAPTKAAQLLPGSSVSATASGKVMPNRRPLQDAWCELCRVDCTSLEILEQHKNGKRHKKNLQKIEELRKWCRINTRNMN
ncbi:hypothetical protein Dsin_004759 [Dipteronia sinensis]|uniref:U1-type domain-containing protein n=1 Tax=Dipteronia sinensis TaxID=43782 RepID=A0AAE0AVK6_9ROSI|nr:hypothetical protein Dsin_004759 [Dipteronia sinensis]